MINNITINLPNGEKLKRIKEQVVAENLTISNLLIKACLFFMKYGDGKIDRHSNKTKRLIISSTDKEAMQKIKDTAADLDVPVSDYVITALFFYLENRDKYEFKHTPPPGKKKGFPPQKRKRTNTSIYLTKENNDIITKVAKERNITKKQVIMEALKETGGEVPDNGVKFKDANMKTSIVVEEENKELFRGRSKAINYAIDKKYGK